MVAVMGHHRSSTTNKMKYSFQAAFSTAAAPLIKDLAEGCVIWSSLYREVQNETGGLPLEKTAASHRAHSRDRLDLLQLPMLLARLAGLQ